MPDGDVDYFDEDWLELVALALGLRAIEAVDHAAERPLRTAHAATSVRLDIPSLVRMFETCTAAVRGEMYSRRASSELLSPSASSAATSRSRGSAHRRRRRRCRDG